MARTFDPSRLFEPRLRAAPFASLAAELDAVRARRKAMSMFPLTRSGVERDDAFYVALVRAAFARGLAVILDPDDPAEFPHGDAGIHAFVLPLDQAWRVPAYRALWTAAAANGWTDAAEVQVGLLLGYGAAERASWLARIRWSQAAWGAHTIYTLLDRPRRRLVDELGRRSLGPAPAIAGMTFFVHRGGHDLRRRAAGLAPAGQAIARVAVAWDASRALFGPLDGRGVATAVVPARLAARLGAALRSNIELLGARGWR